MRLRHASAINGRALALTPQPGYAQCELGLADRRRRRMARQQRACAHAARGCLGTHRGTFLVSTFNGREADANRGFGKSVISVWPRMSSYPRARLALAALDRQGWGHGRDGARHWRWPVCVSVVFRGLILLLCPGSSCMLAIMCSTACVVVCLFCFCICVHANALVGAFNF